MSRVSERDVSTQVRDRELSTVRQAAKLARAAYADAKAVSKTLTRLNAVRLFGHTMAGGWTGGEHASPTDSFAIQVLMKMRDAICELQRCPLGDDETELDRMKSVTAAMKAMGDYEVATRNACAKTLDRSARQTEAAAKLALSLKVHQDNLALKKEQDPSQLSRAELLGISDAAGDGEPVVILDG